MPPGLTNRVAGSDPLACEVVSSLCRDGSDPFVDILYDHRAGFKQKGLTLFVAESKPNFRRMGQTRRLAGQTLQHLANL